MSGKPKLRVTVTAVIEYEPDPRMYPEDMRTPERMLSTDLVGAEEDTLQFIDTDKAEWTITGEVING